MLQTNKKNQILVGNWPYPQRLISHRCFSSMIIVQYLFRDFVVGQNYAVLCLYNGIWCRATLFEIDWQDEVLKLEYTGWERFPSLVKCEVYINSILIRDLEGAEPAFLSLSREDYSSVRKGAKKLGFPKGYIRTRDVYRHARYAALYHGAADKDPDIVEQYEQAIDRGEMILTDDRIFSRNNFPKNWHNSARMHIDRNVYGVAYRTSAQLERLYNNNYLPV